MAAFSSAAFDVNAFSESAFDFSSVPPTPVVDDELRGGRRIYDPDDKKQKVKTRKLRKEEQRDLDKMFAERVAPRYVSPKPEPSQPVKRETPYVPPVEPKKPDRVTAARQFMALDALDDFLAEREQTANENARAVEVAHIKAKQHAKFLEREQQRLARDAERRAESDRQAEVQRAQLAQRHEEDRIAAEQAEQERQIEAQRQSDEDEMIFLLLKVHLGELG